MIALLDNVQNLVISKKLVNKLDSVGFITSLWLGITQWIANKISNFITCNNITFIIVTILQVFAIEFGDFAIEFGDFAIEFVGFAIEFVPFAIEFVAFAIEFVTFAVKFVRNKNGSWSKHENMM